MYRPHVAILLMCVSRKTRRVNFRGLTGSQRTPRVRGVTKLVEAYMSIFFSHALTLKMRGEIIVFK